MEVEAFQPHETEKLARAAAVLAEAEAEAQRLGVAVPLIAASEPGAAGTRLPREHRPLPLRRGRRLGLALRLPQRARRRRRPRPPGVRQRQHDRIRWRSGKARAFRRFRDGLAGGALDLPCRACPKRFMI
ncbi:MAG: hypothetical protein MZV70_20350 [Desulfobacterales bacterium]|nr:hypothetical protein [Desulfobacterales bacterium]